MIPLLAVRFHVVAVCPERQSQESILQICIEQQPCVILIEDLPFRSDESADHLMPLLRRLKSQRGRDPLVICSIRDVLTVGGRSGAKRDDDIAAALNEQFDAVLVHSDPRFARLEEFFLPRAPVSTPVHHTGFLQPAGSKPTPVDGSDRARRVLVSTTPSRTGARLFRAAVEAHRLLWDAHRLRMTVVGNPTVGSHLLKRSDLPQCEGLTLQRSVADLGHELSRVRWSVCDCSPDTAHDVMAAQTAALFVPEVTYENYPPPAEQIERARRLARLQMGRVLSPAHLNGASIASGIQQLMKFRPAETPLSQSGAIRSADLIIQLTSQRV